jgi:hypothetical protein
MSKQPVQGQKPCCAWSVQGDQVNARAYGRARARAYMYGQNSLLFYTNIFHPLARNDPAHPAQRAQPALLLCFLNFFLLAQLTILHNFFS